MPENTKQHGSSICANCGESLIGIETHMEDGKFSCDMRGQILQHFLYGSVIVRTILIEATDEVHALAILKDTKPSENNNKICSEYKLHWGEVPGGNITQQRDGVLNEFLNLIQVKIPRADMPENIIIPPTIGG